MITMGATDSIRHDALLALTREHLTFTLPGSGETRIDRRYHHWRWHMGEDNVAWLLLDREDVSTNTLSLAVMAEFDRVLTEIEQAAPRALVLRSAKANGFAAGADISDFTSMVVAAEVRAVVSEGVRHLDRLAALPFPTIAVIHGFCLGGGLELALACRIRIARDDARLGFPEVMLGLHPGLGGTWRSLGLASDPVEAMTLMLTGRTIEARQAKRLNLVDVVVPERHVAGAVQWAIDSKLNLTRTQPLKARAMLSAPVRAFIAAKMVSATEEKAPRQHYPAPYALIDLWREHGGNAATLRSAETESFARMITGETAQNLIRVYFLRERLKAFGKGTSHDIRHVHVIGAGVMGGDIAAWLAKQGLHVTLQDRDVRLIGPAIQRAAKLFAGRRGNRDIRPQLDRLVPDPKGYGLAKADLVIEAVPEQLDLKRQVLADAEARMRTDAILATNTSSLRLESLHSGLRRPGQFLGLHFFNPVARMPLVEVVTHELLEQPVQARVLSLVEAIDKLPLPVKSAPGFLVNRILTPYMLEALLAHDEGVRPEVIDAVAVNFGMPMGPIELADTVGLDVALNVVRSMKGIAGASLPDLPDWFVSLVNDGKLGRKTGQGLYPWKDGKPVKAKVEFKPDPLLEDRLMLPLVNTTMWCVRRGIVIDEDAADAGVIFGTGFAPFRGGPLHYARKRGVNAIVERLQLLADQYGSRFAPDAGWQNLKP